MHHYQTHVLSDQTATAGSWWMATIRLYEVEQVPNSICQVLGMDKLPRYMEEDDVEEMAHGYALYGSDESEDDDGED
jgi:hypothetical protein